jgi:hypothetical protein
VKTHAGHLITAVVAEATGHAVVPLKDVLTSKTGIDATRVSD